MSVYGFDYPVDFLLFFNFALPPIISPITHTQTHRQTHTHLSLFIFKSGPLGQYSEYLCSPKEINPVTVRFNRL